MLTIVLSAGLWAVSKILPSTGRRLTRPSNSSGYRLGGMARQRVPPAHPALGAGGRHAVILHGECDEIVTGALGKWPPSGDASSCVPRRCAPLEGLRTTRDTTLRYEHHRLPRSAMQPADRFGGDEFPADFSPGSKREHCRKARNCRRHSTATAGLRFRE